MPVVSSVATGGVVGESTVAAMTTLGVPAAGAVDGVATSEVTEAAPQALPTLAAQMA